MVPQMRPPRTGGTTLFTFVENAQSKGGKCLSPGYINSYTKLEWECSLGHRWLAEPNAIREGRWCPKCAGKAKRTLDDCHEAATSKGGKFLSLECLGTEAKHLWECTHGHQWLATLGSVLFGHWCKTCAGTNLIGIEFFHQLASSRGGKCLSTNYVNSYTNLNFECDKGHRWMGKPAGVKSGSWCPHCLKSSLEEMHALAAQREGRCLSKSYVSMATKIEWECKDGHRWKSLPSDVKYNKHWCPTCAGQLPVTLEEMKNFATSKGGECLATKSANQSQKVKWRCGKGHEWEQSPRIARRNFWCLICSGSSKRTIDDAQNAARLRDGECLSSTYVGNKKPLRWKCLLGHEWETSYNSVQRGQWCPHCKKKGENFLRQAFEELEGAPFDSVRPSWLLWKNGHKLELDGYNEKLELAFEYQGAQHLAFFPLFHKSEADFELQKEKDDFKKKACAAKGVFLISLDEVKILLLKRSRKPYNLRAKRNASPFWQTPSLWK